MIKRHIGSICFGFLITAFTVYCALDTFVLRDVYQINTTQMNMEAFEDIEERELSPITSQTAENSAEENNNSNQEDSGTESSYPVYQGKLINKNNSQTNNKTKRENYKRFKELSEEDGYYYYANYNGNYTMAEEDVDRVAIADLISEDNDSEMMADYADAVASGIVYEDEDIRIILSEYLDNETHIYVADVELSSAVWLKTAFAQDTYGKNVTDSTSDIAVDHNAILAINGDNYGSQETGYVIRNGVIYRDRGNGKDVLCIFADGSMNIVNSDEYTAEELLEMGAWQVLCFGPALVKDGEISVTGEDEVGKARASNPRTAIGMIDTCHYIMIVADGRTDESDGLTLYELAQFMQHLGVFCAYNLDGGGSSTMVFQEQVINNPTSYGEIRERSVNDIVYIG